VHAANVIKWTEGPGGYLPEVHLRHWESRRTSKIRSHPAKPSSCAIPRALSHPDTDTGRNRITALSTARTEPGEPLTYLLVSDTDQRLLRAFFPTPDTASHLVHLGFYHNDTPGALSAMMQALARAEFNIVAGLLRKQDRLRSVWEVVLEYRGASTMPTMDRARNSVPGSSGPWLS